MFVPITLALACQKITKENQQTNNQQKTSKNNKKKKDTSNYPDPKNPTPKKQFPIPIYSVGPLDRGVVENEAGSLARGRRHLELPSDQQDCSGFSRESRKNLHLWQLLAGGYPPKPLLFVSNPHNKAFIF